MSLRTMLPSRAKVGDTIHFAFLNVGGKTITGFQVTINGESVSEPETALTHALEGGAANFVFRVKEPGTYQFVITPISEAGEHGQPRLNTLEVATQFAASPG